MKMKSISELLQLSTITKRRGFKICTVKIVVTVDITYAMGYIVVDGNLKTLQQKSMWNAG